MNILSWERYLGDPSGSTHEAQLSAHRIKYTINLIILYEYFKENNILFSH